MAIIQQKERELRYGRLQNLQQEAAVSANYMRDMIRAYGVDLKYYKLKCPYPEVFKPILDMNNLTMHAYGYDPTPEYEVETPLIAYWQFSDDTLVLNAYGIQPNRVAKCWIDATDFAIAFAKKLAEYKEYPIDRSRIIEVTFDNAQDFIDNIDKLQLEFRSDLFNGECSPVFTDAQKKALCEFILDITTPSKHRSLIFIDGDPDTDSEFFGKEYRVSFFKGRMVVSEVTSEESSMEESGGDGDPAATEITKLRGGVPCVVKKIDDSYLTTPHVVPDFWKGMKYEDFINNSFDSYIKLHLNHIQPYRDGSFTLKYSYSGAIIFYDLNKVSKYLEFIKPDVGDVVSIPVYDRGDTISRFEIVNIVGTKYNESYQNPFLRNYIYECDLRTYVSSGEQVPEERDSEKKYRKLNELINLSNSEAGRKISLYKDHEEDIYGGYDKLSGLDGAVLASDETRGIKAVNGFKEREGEGTPPEGVTEEELLSGDIDVVVLADLVFPKPLSVVLLNNEAEDWSRIALIDKGLKAPDAQIPWQHFLRCSDDTLVLRKDNRIYRLATILESCELYSKEPNATIKPRRLKRNVLAQRGGWNDQPFNVVDSEESQLDLGNYAETLTGPKAGEEYKGDQIKNVGLSRMIWRNTRSYMDVALRKDDTTGLEYYQLAVVLKADRRKRRFPIACLKA